MFCAFSKYLRSSHKKNSSKSKISVDKRLPTNSKTMLQHKDKQNHRLSEMSEKQQEENTCNSNADTNSIKRMQCTTFDCSVCESPAAF